MPPYPYSPNVDFPEANFGLYGGGTIQSGNKISQGRNKGKTLRKWFPNIRLEKVRSEALDMELSIPIRARVMRTIRKCGGLDQYILGDKPGRIKELGLLGWKLRYKIMQTPSVQKAFRAERIKQGLPEEDPATETFQHVWDNPKRRAELIAQQDEAWRKMRADVEKWQDHVERQWEESDDESYITEKHRQGTLMDRLPSKMTLPEVIEAEQLEFRLPQKHRRETQQLLEEAP